MKRISPNAWVACACFVLVFFVTGTYRKGFAPVSSDISRAYSTLRGSQNPARPSFPVANLYPPPVSRHASNHAHDPFDQERYTIMNRHPVYREGLGEVGGRFPGNAPDSMHHGAVHGAHGGIAAHGGMQQYERGTSFYSGNNVISENRIKDVPFFHSSVRSDSYYNDDGSQFYSNDFGAGTAYSFSNDDRWNREEQFSTITTLTMRGEYYVIGRGSCGIRIVKVGNHGVELVNDCDIPFSNDKHWDRRALYETISAQVVNGYIYIFGRDDCGMRIYKVVGNNIKTISVCEIPFSDSYNWYKERYYKTIQSAVVNDQLYIMGRGVCGMHIYKIYNDYVYKVSQCDIPFSDYNGWAKPSYYETITNVEFRGHIYVMGRHLHGMVVYRTIANNKVELVSNEEIPFSDKDDWYYGSRFRTIQSHADSQGIFVLGRSRSGIIVYKLVDGDAKLFNNAGVVFSNGRGWASVWKYATIGSAVVNDSLYVWGLESCGLKIYKVDRDNVDLVSDCVIPFSKSNFFESSSCYRTIQGAASENGLVITGRTYCGMSVYDRVESKLRQRAICV